MKSSFKSVLGKTGNRFKILRNIILFKKIMLYNEANRNSYAFIRASKTYLNNTLNSIVKKGTPIRIIAIESKLYSTNQYLIF